jgi:hypothetical protein
MSSRRKAREARSLLHPKRDIFRSSKRHLGTPFEITATIACYLLPGDGVIARQELLNHINDPGEIYIIAYGFTLVPLVDELIAVHQKGSPSTSSLTTPNRRA